MKTRFSNNKELAHIWAQQNQSEGRGNNMFFRDRSIFSYGEHFEIARFVTPEVVFFNPARYSNTTTRHQSYTHRAVYHKTVFTVPSMTDHNENAAALIRAIKEDVASLKRGRTGFEYKMTAITSAILNAEKYESIFKRSLNRKTRDAIKKLSAFQKKEISPEWLDQQIKKENERARIHEERQRVAREERRKRVLIEQAENIEKWKNGESVYPGYEWPTLLRVKDDNIETSHGAKIPLLAARRLWRRFLKGPANLAGLSLGSYTVDRVEMFDPMWKDTPQSGHLIVGCHTIDFSELYRMADVLGWRDGVPFDATEVLQ